MPSKPTNGRGEVPGEPQGPAPRRTLGELLPAFYRENEELLGPLPEVGEELAQGLLTRIDALERSPAAVRALDLGPGLAPDRQGTPGALALLVSPQLNRPFRLWNGIEPLEHPLGGLVFRPARQRSVVLAWEKGGGKDPGGFRVDPERLPVGVTLHVVQLARLPRKGAPHVGERFSGEIVLRQGAEINEDASRWT